MKLKCPVCGNTSCAQVRSGQMRCNLCGTTDKAAQFKIVPDEEKFPNLAEAGVTGILVHDGGAVIDGKDMTLEDLERIALRVFNCDVVPREETTRCIDDYPVLIRLAEARRRVQEEPNAENTRTFLRAADNAADVLRELGLGG